MNGYGNLGRLKKREIVGGILYWPCYLFFSSLVLGLVLPLIGVDIQKADGRLTLNIVWSACNFAAILLIFRSYLLEQLGRIGTAFWGFVQAIILALALYYALNIAYALLYSSLNLQLENINNEIVNSMLEVNQTLMLLMALLLAPITEECLCRGLIFGGLYKKSRVLAYALSMLAFSLIHVLGSIGEQDALSIVLCAVQYLPAGFALAWAYKKSGTVWAAIITHILINLLTVIH